MDESEYLLIGAAAVALGVGESLLRKAARKGIVPAKQIGHYRAFRRSDLPVIRERLIAAGYLMPPTTLPTR